MKIRLKGFILGFFILASHSHLAYADDSLNPFLDLPNDCSALNLMCKEYSPTSRLETRYLKPEDYSVTCKTGGAVALDFFNSSSSWVVQIGIEGVDSGLTLTQDIAVAPGKSFSVIIDSSGAICKLEKSTYVFVIQKVLQPSQCLKYRPKAELDQRVLDCKRENMEIEARVKKKAERAYIYSNCFVDKSRGVERFAINEVESLCIKISENPSMWQRWWWGQ